MSLRNRITPQQLLAVSFALIMLVSMGGMAFVGGAGAQAGGTYEDIAPDEVSINDNQNISDGTGEVVTLSDDGDGVATRDDGAVDFSEPADDNFGGVAIDEDRYAALFDGVDANAGPADQLSALDDVSISTEDGDTTGISTGSPDSGAYPAVLVELAPQSEFSQHPDLDGEDDYIFIVGEASDLTGDGSVGAYAVNSDDSTATQITSGGGFSDVITTLTDDGLTNDNIDQVRIGAGIGAYDVLTDVDGAVNTFSSSTVTDIDVTVDGETRLVQNEKIALDDGEGDNEYFATIDNSSGAVSGSTSGALQAAADGDQIIVDNGDYSALEPDSITVDNDVTITGANSADVDARLDDDDFTDAEDYEASETVVGADIEFASDGATLENLAVGNPVDATANTQQITNDATDAANVTIENTIVNGPTEEATPTAIDLTGVADAQTIDNVAVIGDTAGPAAGTGLDVNTAGDLTVENSYFAGYQTQVNGDGDVNETAIYESNEFSHAAVPVNETGVVVGNQIAGVIDTAAADAEAGNTIEVTSDGIFSEYDVSSDSYGDVTLEDADADDLSLVDVDDGATITSSISVNSGGEVSVEGFTVDGGLDTVETGTPSAISVNGTDIGDGTFDLDDIATVELDGTTGGHYDLGTDVSAETVNVSDAAGTQFSIDSTANVDLDQIEAESPDELTDPVVDVDTSEAGDVSVTDSQIRNLNVSDTGLDINAADVDSETVTVSDVTVTGAGDVDTPTGIALANVNTQAENEYVLRDNDLTGLDEGTGIDIDEGSGGETGAVVIDQNELRGNGTEFTGLAYNMPDTQTVNVTANTIVGGDVDGAENSVGVDFEEVAPFSSSNVFQAGSDDVMTFEDNVITGHARLVQDAGNDGATIQASGYNAILTNEELNNSYGTQVVGADGATYAETYGEPTASAGNEFEGLTGAQSYVPGSINEAVNLVDANDDNTGADLVINEPDVGVNGPETYDDDTVELPDLSGVSITGNATDGSVTANTDFSIDESGAENNHSVSDLTIVNDDGGSAIDIQSDNAQVDFDNLDVTSDGEGLTVGVSEDDVNVVNVTNSAFNVTEAGTNGIVLNAGTSDDRDGFVIDNVTVDGPGIGAADSTGLDLTGVDKPGKDGLPVNLTVTESDITDFETIVAIDDSDAGVDTDAEAFLNDGSGVEGVTINGNTFEQAIVVDAADGNTDVPSLYGSLDQADADADTGDTIEIVGTGDYNHNDEVDIATKGVTVTGPTDGDAASDRPEDVVIQDPLAVSGSNSVTIEGIAVVPNDVGDFSNVLTSSEYGAAEAGTQTAVIGYASVGDDAGAADGDLTVQDVSVSTDLDSSDEAMPVGIGAADSASSLTVDNTFVGDHTAGETTGTGVVAEDDVAFTLTDSVLADGTDGDGTDAYGVLAADSTSPEIRDTEITGFDQAGVNTESSSAALTLTEGDSYTITGEELEAEEAIGDQNDTSEYSTEFDGSAADGFVVDETQLDPDVFGVEFTFNLTGDVLVENGSAETPGANVTIDQLKLTRTSDAGDGSDYGDRADDYELIGVNSATGETTNFTNESSGDAVYDTVSNESTGLTTALDEVNDFEDETGTGVDGFQIDLTQKQGSAAIESITISDTEMLPDPEQDVLVVDGATISSNDVGLETGADIAGASGDAYTVSDSEISMNDGDGINLADVGLDLSGETVVSDNADGVVVAATGSDVDIDGVDIRDNDNDGVELEVNSASIANNNIEDNDVGLDVVDVGAESTIAQNTIADNNIGLNVAAGASADQLVVRTNDITSEELEIDSEEDLDATLNYFGTNLGPNDAAGVDDTVTYDPFLTESQLETSAADVESTTSFGHDVVIPGGDSVVSVGFPAEPEADTVGEVINGDVAGAVYKWDQDNKQFSSASMDTEIGAFDVLVVENRDNKPTTAAITYKDDSARNDPVDNTFTFQEGLNFVPAQQTGTVEEALFAGDGADYVAQPFSSGENLYGDRDADQVRDQFTSPSEDGFGSNFASGVGDEIVHPHTGYFVIVNDESNYGNTRSEQIPNKGVPTADTIDSQTGFTPATFELSSPSVTANATTDTVDVIVDVENIGDVDGTADITATALTGLDDSTTDTIEDQAVATNDDSTVQLSITDADALDPGEQVRVEIEVDGTDETVKVTTQAQA